MKKKIFVLDTNVLMHDPSSLFRFEEHDLFIPMVVLEELDGLKKGTTDTARTARQVSRLLDDLVAGKDHAQIEKGLSIPTGLQRHNGPNGGRHGEPASGKLFFQTQPTATSLPGILPGNKPDNSILLTALALQGQQPNRRVTLVSKDINLRLKAAIVGVHTEDYHNDQVLDDLDLLPSGYAQLADDFWQTHGEKMESWQDERGRACYKLQGPNVKDWHVNQFVFMPDENERGLELMVQSIDGDTAKLRVIRDYRAGKTPV